MLAVVNDKLKVVQVFLNELIAVIHLVKLGSMVATGLVVAAVRPPPLG
jgi:hypothetical protein